MSFNILIPSLGMAAVVLSSCAPLTPYEPTSPSGSQQIATSPGQMTPEQQAAEQKRIADAQAEARRQAENRENTQVNNSGTASGENSGTSTPDVEPDKPDYRRAIPIPGREGMVFNPFTNNPVDVRGIPSGSLVRDPADPNMEHKFRVP